jgi:hypothetical protein
MLEADEVAPVENERCVLGRLNGVKQEEARIQTVNG